MTMVSSCMREGLEAERKATALGLEEVQLRARQLEHLLRTT